MLLQEIHIKLVSSRLLKDKYKYLTFKYQYKYKYLDCKYKYKYEYFSRKYKYFSR